MIKIKIRKEKMIFESHKHFVRTKRAILGPTPISKSSSKIELGMSPSYFKRKILAIKTTLFIASTVSRPF